MPYISAEALVGAALLVVLAVSYHYLPQANGASGSKASKKKSKKKAKFEAPEEIAPVPLSKVGKKGKRKPSGRGQADDGTTPLHISAGSDEDFVVPIAPAETTALAAVAGSSSPAKPKTLVERLKPKRRKTKVDDMLAPEDQPATYARVMKVTPTVSAPVPTPTPPPETKIAKFEADYASSSENETSGTGTAEIEEDDGWDVVPSRKNKPISISMSSGTSQSTSDPLPIATKLQKKNAKKADAKKAAKAADEADRQRRLATHKRDIEKERINEIYSQKKKTTVLGPAIPGTTKATLDTNGKLIWD